MRTASLVCIIDLPRDRNQILQPEAVAHSLLNPAEMTITYQRGRFRRLLNRRLWISTRRTFPPGLSLNHPGSSWVRIILQRPLSYVCLPLSAHLVIRISFLNTVSSARWLQLSEILLPELVARLDQGLRPSPCQSRRATQRFRGSEPHWVRAFPVAPRPRARPESSPHLSRRWHNLL